LKLEAQNMYFHLVILTILLYTTNYKYLLEVRIVFNRMLAQTYIDGYIFILYFIFLDSDYIIESHIIKPSSIFFIIVLD